MEILVFKTNLTNKKRISDLEPVLNIHPHIIKWNVDLHDRDNVLRVVSTNIEAKDIEELVINAGFHCEELR